MDTIKSILTWHQRARPEPTPQNFGVQYGCHLEELAEQLSTMTFNGTKGANTQAYWHIKALADNLKSGVLLAGIMDRKEFLDAFADQVVTGIGCVHCAVMDGELALKRVDTSNWTKFDKDGQPIFNDSGKIQKGPDYQKPDLEGCY